MNAKDSSAPAEAALRSFSRWRRLSIVLLIVVALGGVTWRLAGAVTSARAAVRKSSCDCRLKQIGLGLQNFADVHKRFPAAYTLLDGAPGASWRVEILQFIEKQDVYDRYRKQEAWDSPLNWQLADEAAAVHQPFRCPAAPETQEIGLANYVMPVGPGTISEGALGVRFSDIRDGSSNTIAVTEVFPTDIYWTEPRDLPADKMRYQVNDPRMPGISSMHPACAMAVFADGHTQTLSDSIDPEVLKALLTINGREQIKGDY